MHTYMGGRTQSMALHLHWSEPFPGHTFGLQRGPVHASSVPARLSACLLLPACLLACTLVYLWFSCGFDEHFSFFPCCILLRICAWNAGSESRIWRMGLNITELVARGFGLCVYVVGVGPTHTQSHTADTRLRGPRRLRSPHRRPSASLPHPAA